MIEGISVPDPGFFCATVKFSAFDILGQQAPVAQRLGRLLTAQYSASVYRCRATILLTSPFPTSGWAPRPRQHLFWVAVLGTTV